MVKPVLAGQLSIVAIGPGPSDRVSVSLITGVQYNLLSYAPQSWFKNSPTLEGAVRNGWLSVLGAPEVNSDSTLPEPLSPDRAFALRTISEHSEAVDPHGDRAFASAADSCAMASHVAATDPRAGRAYADETATGAAGSAVTNHVAAVDPHGDRAYAKGIIAPVGNRFPRAGGNLGLPGAWVQTGSWGSAAVPFINGMMMLPFTAPMDVTVDEATLVVSDVSSGGSAKVAIYEAILDSSGRYTSGGQRLYESGALSTTFTGTKSVTDLGWSLEASRHYILALSWNEVFSFQCAGWVPVGLANYFPTGGANLSRSLTYIGAIEAWPSPTIAPSLTSTVAVGATDAAPSVNWGVLLGW